MERLNVTVSPLGAGKASKAELEEPEELIHLAAVPSAPWLCQHPQPATPRCTALLRASLRAQLRCKPNPQDEMDSGNWVRETSAGFWEGSAVLQQFVEHGEMSPVLCAPRGAPSTA